MTNSCSFRITRTAEDLAQTLTAISQRLVKLEERIEVLELNKSNSHIEQTDEEIVMLDGVDQLLEECKGLLNTANEKEQSDELWVDEDCENHNIAA